MVQVHLDEKEQAENKRYRHIILSDKEAADIAVKLITDIKHHNYQYNKLWQVNHIILCVDLSLIRFCL